MLKFVFTTGIYSKPTNMSFRKRFWRIDTSFENLKFKKYGYDVDMGGRGCQHALVNFENKFS